MKPVELLISCVENYSYVKSVPSNKVADAFAQKGIFEMLLEGYTAFCDMDEGFFLGVIDGYMDNVEDAKDREYTKHRERQAVLPQVVAQIGVKKDMDVVDAMKAFYASRVGEKFAEDSTGYFAKTPAELTALFLQEN